jgi:hypothetical protein
VDTAGKRLQRYGKFRQAADMADKQHFYAVVETPRAAAWRRIW